METQAMGETAVMSNALTQQKEFSARLIQGTIDRLNTDDVTGRVNQDYDFQTKVLSAHGIGRSLNITV